MTRLIDADALNEKLCKTTIFIKDGEMFQRMINNAPTIEPDGDNISRSQAIKGVSEWATDILHPDKLVKEDAIHILESLPSAEQVTGKLKNPCDSLLTKDSEACKEQKSKLDLISRKDAIRKCCGEKCGCEREDCGYTESCLEVSRLERLPSVQPNGDLISRQDALAEFRDGRDVYDIMESIEELLSAPSAEAEDRLYIKIYADDEPSVMAEKLYQICGETQNGEVAEWLKEYFPSAPDSRQRGKWVWDEDAVDWGIGAWVCNKCGSRPQTWWSTDRNKNPLICAGSRFCGNCGADMRKEESEEDHDYERAVDHMIHDITYEPTYNPEDGSM